MKFYDNSQISMHRECPRKFLFRHVYNLVRDYDFISMEKIPSSVAGAEFGRGWHSAMDVVWKEIIEKANDNDRLILEKALVMWEHTFFERIPEGADTGFRSRDTAIEMIDSYIKNRRAWLGRFSKLLSIERPFAVPLYPDDTGIWYCGRLDKLVEMEGKVWVVDHKTTSLYSAQLSSKVQPSFIESFSPNSQIDGYSFGAIILYGPAYAGAFIDGALVHKNERAFPLLSIARVAEQLDAWLWETHEEVARIERYVEVLKRSESDPYLQAFPKNTGACFNYGQCAYLDLCRSWPNPAQSIVEFADWTPPGYKQEPWSPFEQYHLDQIKLVEEKR